MSKALLFLVPPRPANRVASLFSYSVPLPARETKQVPSRLSLSADSPFVGYLTLCFARDDKSIKYVYVQCFGSLMASLVSSDVVDAAPGGV